jgi:hypothetical protein
MTKGGGDRGRLDFTHFIIVGVFGDVRRKSINLVLLLLCSPSQQKSLLLLLLLLLFVRKVSVSRNRSSRKKTI